MMDKRPISVIIPTRNRAKSLLKTLDTFYGQTEWVTEIIIIDGSDNEDSKQVVISHDFYQSHILVYVKADNLGAAAQRNQGVSKSYCPFILFADDDINMEADVVGKLWNGIHLENVGGVNAMITNQRYHTPGRVSSFMYRLMNGAKLESYAGRLIGPAWNLLPEDREDLPEYVECEWLNTTCTLYKKACLPSPVFSSHFIGYSLMEDVTLSAIVNRKWKLLNARTARIYHDSQPGDHKKNQRKLSEMELINRHFVMRYIIGRSGFLDYLKLFSFEVFQILSGIRSRDGLKKLVPELAGKFSASIKMIIKKS